MSRKACGEVKLVSTWNFQGCLFQFLICKYIHYHSCCFLLCCKTILSLEKPKVLLLEIHFWFFWNCLSSFAPFLPSTLVLALLADSSDLLCALSMSSSFKPPASLNVQRSSKAQQKLSTNSMQNWKVLRYLKGHSSRSRYVLTTYEGLRKRNTNLQSVCKFERTIGRTDQNAKEIDAFLNMLLALNPWSLRCLPGLRLLKSAPSHILWLCGSSSSNSVLSSRLTCRLPASACLIFRLILRSEVFKFQWFSNWESQCCPSFPSFHGNALSNVALSQILFKFICNGLPSF